MSWVRNRSKLISTPIANIFSFFFVCVLFVLLIHSIVSHRTSSYCRVRMSQHVLWKSSEQLAIWHAMSCWISFKASPVPIWINRSKSDWKMKICSTRRSNAATMIVQQIWIKTRIRAIVLCKNQGEMTTLSLYLSLNELVSGFIVVV